MSNENDQKIAKYREAVEVKRSKIGTVPKTPMQTNGLLKTLFDAPINLNVATMDECIHIIMALTKRSEHLAEALEFLQLDPNNYNTDIDGYSSHQWRCDVAARVEVLKWHKQKKELGQMDKRLAQLMSEDARTSQEIDNIAKSLGLE